MKKYLLILLLIISSLNIDVAYAQTSSGYHTFSGYHFLSGDFGISVGATDYSRNDAGFFMKWSYEYFLRTKKYPFSLKVFYEMGSIEGTDSKLDYTKFKTDLMSAGATLNYTFYVLDDVSMFTGMGIAMLWFDPKDNAGMKLPFNKAGKYKSPYLNHIFEFGFRYQLWDDFTINAGAEIHVNTNDRLDDVALYQSNDHFFSFTGGISWALFSSPTVDTDGDGVPDNIDQCPNTPKGMKVNQIGCPEDTDGDGVPDFQDRCFGTPKGVAVDQSGCPRDSDDDGVPDYMDRCPGTPSMVAVDQFGCPDDSDNDGVPDYKDKCLDTPAGIEVDFNGCPKDTDSDGVPDYMDQCPDTKFGAVVDEKGCETGTTELEDMNEESDTIEDTDNLFNYETQPTDIVPADDGSTPEDSRGWVLQLSSWKQKSRAEQHKNELRQSGYDAYVEEANVPALGGIWYRVKIGFFNSKDEAANYARSMGIVDYLIK